MDAASLWRVRDSSGRPLGMLRPLVPLRKLRRNGAYLLFGAVLLVAAFAAYLEFVATNTWSNEDDSHQNGKIIYKISSMRREVHRGHASEGYQEQEDGTWAVTYVLQPWRPEYKGQANLHVFEDWCGSSVAKLRKNLHYPLYPHSRSTVKKLAVSPSWTNYGLRIFGYIHPYTDGEFLFAVASDDNSEFWLSQDENPNNLKLRAYVGKTGKEWTVPGEYGKYASQISQPLLLEQKKRYYFELIHKQNDHGTDHVEVAWQLNQASKKFAVIDSQSLSLYTNESSLRMNYVSHIPQTAASHAALLQDAAPSLAHGADMLREDPRDTFYQIPLLDSALLRGVLPECPYKPSYVVKGIPLLRYQGLQFVRLLYVYPNDHTRLTHMENDNKCFYQEKPYYLERYGFSMYMKLDQPGNEDIDFRYRGDVRMGWKQRQDWGDYEGLERAEGADDVKNNEEAEGLPGDGYNDYIVPKERKLFSNSMSKKRRRVQGVIQRRPQQENPPVNETVHLISLAAENQQEPAELQFQNKIPEKSDQRSQKIKAKGSGVKVDRSLRSKHKNDFQGHPFSNYSQRDAQTSAVKTKDFTLVLDEAKKESVKETAYTHFGHNRGNDGNSMWSRNKSKEITKPSALDNPIDQPSHEDTTMDKDAVFVTSNRKPEGPNAEVSLLHGPKQSSLDQENVRGPENSLKLANSGRQNTKKVNVDKDNAFQSSKSNFKSSLLNKVNDSFPEQKETDIVTPPFEENNHSWRRAGTVEEDDKHEPEGDWIQSKHKQESDNDQWELYGDLESDDDFINRIRFDPEVNWAQTFEVKPMDFQNLRSDWIDLTCNVSGNLPISQTEALGIVQAFMERLNQKYPGQFSLQRIVNVEKRPDVARGNRYLLELDLQEASGHRVRLAHYIYGLQYPGQSVGRGVPKQRDKQQLLLCNPRGFQWNPKATVHFIVPVKNQARWLIQFITDMEELSRATGDYNFNIIITDYDSTDMDVKQALKNSNLPRYQYIRLNGNFQRSAGLQAGIDLIEDEHSILFLCDLHIHFPLGFIDSVRRHCIKGRLVFAPIVMRLNCGATPQEPDGYWEVNGFGLLGIYKSDLDSIGGMNTKDFTDRWGGEDWELLDRIMQAGFEVERLYMRNFFHYHHSRRGMWNHRTVRNW